jgi:hypothetical protein
MKMLRIAAGVALSACFVIFAACKSLPTIQQQFEAACPIVTADLTTLSTSPLVGAADQANLAKAAKANANICAGGAALNVTNLKAFHDSLLPVSIAIVQGNPLIPDQTVILLALNTFGPIVQQMIDQIIVAAAGATASSASAASAPAAASTPVAASQ